MTWGTKSIRSDMKGPPNVKPKSRSIPGPAPAKKGIYSIKVTSRTPPAIMRRLVPQLCIKPTKPSLYTALVLNPAMILLLLRM